MRTRWHVSCYISLQCFTVSPFFHIVQQGKNRKHRKRTKGHKRWKLRSGKEIKRDETTTEYWFPKQVTQEVGDVKHLVTHNDPAVLVGVVLGNLLCADCRSLTDMLTRVGCGKSGHQNRATNLLSQDDQNESGIAGSEGTPVSHWEQQLRIYQNQRGDICKVRMAPWESCANELNTL